MRLLILIGLGFLAVAVAIGVIQSLKAVRMWSIIIERLDGELKRMRGERD